MWKILLVYVQTGICHTIEFEAKASADLAFERIIEQIGEGFAVKLY